MIDIQDLRKNPEKYKKTIKDKGYKIDLDKVIYIDNERKNSLTDVEKLRQKRNEITEKIKKDHNETIIEEAKAIKKELSDKEENLRSLELQWQEQISQIPNPILQDVPIGSEENFIVVKQFGENKKGGVDHLELAEKRDWVDFSRGSKVAGNKFYYLKGDLALLENAVVQFALDLAIKKDFKYMTVPHMVTSKILTGTGFAPRSSEQSDDYFIEGEDLALIATAEIALTGYHMDDILDHKDLPLKYVGYSPCYRKEAGAYGKHTRGLFRVHQFNKLEFYIYCLPEDSQKMHEYIKETEEEIWQLLDIPYRVINIASGDLGAAAAKKYDIEYWSPVDGTYRELTSCSNCTDYQSRNLNIRTKLNDGKYCLLHSLNGTAVSTARTMVAIMDNYQRDDGQILVPKVLQKYMNGKEVI